MKGHPLHPPQFSIGASFAWQPNEVQHCNISIIWLRSAQTSDFLPMWKWCSEIWKGLLKDLTVPFHRFTNFMLKVGNIRSKCNSFGKRMKLTLNYVTLPWFCHLSSVATWIIHAKLFNNRTILTKLITDWFVKFYTILSCLTKSLFLQKGPWLVIILWP